MSQELYYTAPSDKIFRDIKENAIKIWRSYDDTHGYATEKIDRIKDIPNSEDNYMYMVAMFDSTNQAKLLKMVDSETALRILEAMK